MAPARRRPSTLTLSFPILLALGAALLLACGGDDAQPRRPAGEGEPRPFRMGLSALPAEPGDDAYREAFRLAGEAGGGGPIPRAPPRAPAPLPQLPQPLLRGLRRRQGGLARHPRLPHLPVREHAGNPPERAQPARLEPGEPLRAEDRYARRLLLSRLRPCQGVRPAVRLLRGAEGPLPAADRLLLRRLELGAAPRRPRPRGGGRAARLHPQGPGRRRGAGRPPLRLVPGPRPARQPRPQLRPPGDDGPPGRGRRHEGRLARLAPACPAPAARGALASLAFAERLSAS